MTNFHDVLILGQDALQGEQHGVPGLVVPEEVEVLLEGAEEAGPGGGEEVGPGHHLPGEQVALRVEGRGDQQGPPWEDESESVGRADGKVVRRGEDVISWAPLGRCSHRPVASVSRRLAASRSSTTDHSGAPPAAATRRSTTDRAVNTPGLLVTTSSMWSSSHLAARTTEAMVPARTTACTTRVPAWAGLSAQGDSRPHPDDSPR